MDFDRLALILPLRLRSLFSRHSIEGELDEELQYHIERQTEENIRRGMAPDAARQAARIALGSVALRKDEMRDTRGLRWLEELVSDVRVSLRTLAHSPGYTATVVLTLALGIGANTAMFTLLRGTLLRPLPNADADRIVYMRIAAPATGQTDLRFSVPEIADYRAASRTVAAFAEYSTAVPFTMGNDNGAPSRVTVGIVSGNYFDVVGLGAAAGRLLSPHDDGAAAVPVGVLSYEFWVDHFGGDPRVVGRTLRLNDRVVTVVGVAQPAPRFPDAIDVFANTVTSPHNMSAEMVTLRGHRMSRLFARLAPGSTVRQARTELEHIAADMFRTHPESYAAADQYTISVESLRTVLNERAVLTMWLLMGAAAFVLLIAFANVTNVTLMRSVGRGREMVIRTALGAGRGRLRRLLAVENLLLALAGGVLGVLATYAALHLLVAFAAQFSPRAAEIHVDRSVLALGLLSSLLAAIGLALVQPLGGRRKHAPSLVPAGSRATLGPRRQRIQRFLVIGQVAVSMVLVTGAGLLARTIAKLQTVETGVRMDHVLTLEMPLGDIVREMANQAANLSRYEAMRDRVASLPGVNVVSLSAFPPLRESFLDLDVKADGRPIAPNEPTPHAPFRPVDPNYFSAVGMSILRGRGFEPTDRLGAARVAILSQSLARQLYGDADPIGHRIAPTGEALKVSPFTDDWRTVVGVVSDARNAGVASNPTPALYEPFAQEFVPGGSLVVLSSLDPAALGATIVRTIHDMAPQQLIEHVETLDQIRDESVAPRRLNALFVAVFGGLALVIAMVGIGGVLAFSVRSRTAEIGIRMSLGADAARVRGMVLTEGGTLLIAGVAIGLVLALFATRVLRGLLFGITPHDPFVLGAAVISLAGVGLLACWIPAARAAHVDPAITLRSE